MRIDIKTNGVECDAEIREHVHRRAAFALSRFGDALQEVGVSLADTNGPRGGADKCCKLVVRVRRHDKPIVVETTHEEISAAVDLSFGRVSRTVARVLDLQSDRLRPIR